ncbi:hypothetical protein [Succinimonas sp.]
MAADDEKAAVPEEFGQARTDGQTWKRRANMEKTGGAGGKPSE